MNEQVVVLPPGVAIAILAFLLSLLPAGLFIWVWYLRRHERSVPAMAVVKAFGLGMFLVAPAFLLEKWAPVLWQMISPGTAYYFTGALSPIQGWADILWPAVGTFLIVALVEEGVRYLALWGWFRKSQLVDQVFDGLVLGLAAGLGFATLENSAYFFQLFSAGNFDTLVFVFFLRFLVSTLAHISFGGIMGVMLARGLFSVYNTRRYWWQAFLAPWCLHGFYDWMLAIDQTMYAVLLLLVPLIVLVLWTGRRDFYAIGRDSNGRLLVNQEPPAGSEAKVGRVSGRHYETPWNTQAPWLKFRRAYRSNFNNLS
ncbi:MAG: PrsW family glutamic-type intramembrane protease [Candidatus Andersenbacteria bacterium]|nr:PrsW family glutamic-type intramembrane protease [bacterium]MDZ4225257.1 PrsW family glutamic-type intramembrane protease [Candidatus Andersenbacteria bacterium]